MTDPDYLKSLAQRAQRAYGAGKIEDIRERTRAIVGRAFGEKAARALEALREGETPSPSELAALEWSLRMLRPALRISSKNRVPPLPATHPEVTREFPDWESLRQTLDPWMGSVGRIELLWDGDRSMVGTGFLVAEDLVLTNRHVLDELSCGSRTLEGEMATIQFRYEHGVAPAEEPIALTGVRHYSRTHDLALLELEPQTGRPVVELAARVAEPDEPVVAIGFPAEKSARNPRFVDALFGEALGVKRASPGSVVAAQSDLLSHDCSTLGGSSGSPLFSQRHGDLVGVHFSGTFAWRNDAVPGDVVAEFVKASANR